MLSDAVLRRLDRRNSFIPPTRAAARAACAAPGRWAAAWNFPISANTCPATTSGAWTGTLTRASTGCISSSLWKSRKPRSLCCWTRARHGRGRQMGSGARHRGSAVLSGAARGRPGLLCLPARGGNAGKPAFCRPRGLRKGQRVFGWRSSRGAHAPGREGRRRASAGRARHGGGAQRFVLRRRLDALPHPPALRPAADRARPHPRPGRNWSRMFPARCGWSTAKPGRRSICWLVARPCAPTAARWQNSSPARRIGAISTPCAMRRWPRTRICSPRCSARSRARG